MNFESLRADLSTAQRTIVEDRLRVLESASGIGYQLVINLRNESRLDELALRDIVEGLLQAAANPGALKDAYVEACWGHILEGGAIPRPWALCFGRVVSVERFYRTMLNFGYYRTEDQVKHALERLLSKPLHATHAELRNKFIGQFLMWATFNPDDLNGHPFSGMPKDADGLRARLGVHSSERGQDLFLLVYRLPPDVAPLFPTIADAQGYSLFRPSPPEEKSGLTMPWAEIDGEKPLPEVVHNPIKGICLIEPIQIARART
jgi:hypothetical protein